MKNECDKSAECENRSKVVEYCCGDFNFESALSWIKCPVDTAVYQRSDNTWEALIYDPEHHLTNADGLRADLKGKRTSKDGDLLTKVLVL